MSVIGIDIERDSLLRRARSSEPLSQQDLNDSFALDLSSVNLIDPINVKSVVTGIVEVRPNELTNTPSNVAIYDVFVEDPFISADYECYRLITDHIERIQAVMNVDGFFPVKRRQAIALGRLAINPYDFDGEAVSRDDYNPYTKAWTHGKQFSGVDVWRDLVPSAEALHYLTHPFVGEPISSKHRKGDKGLEGVVTKETAAQLRFTADGIAIRDRAAAMESLVAEYLINRNGSSSQGLSMLSLACGTAEPAILAAKCLQDLSPEAVINLRVVDYDRASLALAAVNAKQIGFKGKFEEQVANILAPGFIEDDKRFDVVENLGFQEYLPQEGDELGAIKGAELPQASEFTKNAFDLVKPGGILISGNMIFNRPQCDFVFGIVDWPLINARSEESILRVYKEAGILDDPAAKVEMYRIRNNVNPDYQHVYNIVKVTKL